MDSTFRDNGVIYPAHCEIKHAIRYHQTQTHANIRHTITLHTTSAFQKHFTLLNLHGTSDDLCGLFHAHIREPMVAGNLKIAFF